MGAVQNKSEPNLPLPVRGEGWGEGRSAGHPFGAEGSGVKASPRLELGRAGERAAADLLRRRGYEVVGTGFRARRGELDLVCSRGSELVIVEVKTRTDERFGTPLEAVGPRKRRALVAAAAEYRALARWRGPIRFAVVGED
jgi:putative endonuclease